MLSNPFQNLPQGWEILPFSKCVNKISIKHKVKTKDYLKNGKYPIIDQAKDFISGYSNDENLLINIKKPVIVFGDHTRCFKFIDFNFIAGADGIKILSPIDEFNEKLFYYFCLALKFEDKGYSRHYQFLEKTNINIPPLETQKAIVEKLENAFAHIDEAVRHLKAVQTNIPRLKSSLLHCTFSGKLTESQNSSHKVQTLKKCVVGEEGETSALPLHPLIKTEIPQGWEIKTLGEVCEFVYGKALNQTKRKTNGKYPVYAANGIKDYSDEFMISENSIIVGRKGSVGSVVLTSSPCWVLDVAYYVNFDKEKYNLVFLYHLLKYLNLKQFARGVKPGISRSQIYELQVVMPLLATQNQIVQILESKFTHLDNLAQFVNASLENLQRLKSSLLNQAFKGELIC